MIKLFLFVIFLLTALSSFSQGTLRVSIFINETGNLIDNILVDSATVEVYQTYDEAKLLQKFTFSSENKNCSIKPGVYNICLNIPRKKTIKICEVQIRDSETTFLNFVIEPQISHTKKELRRRKHYENYKKNKCI